MSGWKSSTHHPLTVRLVKLAAQRMQGRPDALGDFTVAVDHGGGCFSIELHMLESLENPLMNLPVNRHDETFNRWIDEWFRDYLSAEPAPESTAQDEPAKNPEPPPLTTGDIASAFDGLRWTEAEWKKPLGDKPKWLAACVSIPGRRGSIETRWNPVCIGGALIFSGHVQARGVRARFQTNHLLHHWFDAWKTYEADNLDTL